MRGLALIGLIAGAAGLWAQTPAALRERNLAGIKLSSEGRHEEAIEQFRLALKVNPKFVPALKNLAMAEMLLGRNADARRHFETALASVPKDPSVRFGLGQLDYREQRFPDAVKHFELIPAVAPGQVNFEAGVMLAKMEQYRAAARQFALAKSAGADVYDVDFNLTLAHFNAKNYAAAVVAGNAMVQRGTATTELYRLLSKAHEGAGNTKEAYEALRAATRLDPREEAAYLDLIALCVAHENYDLSFEIADIGLRVNSNAFRIRVDRGVVLALTGRMEEAEKEFTRAAESAPGEMLPQLARAIALMEMNRLPETIEVLQSWRRQHAEHYLVEWHLAEALIRQGGAESEAMRALRRSVALDGSVARTHFLLGKLLAQAGEIEAAIRELEAALRVEPGDISALYLLAQTYRKKGDAARASELFAKVSQSKAEAAERQSGRGSLKRIVRDGSR